MSDDGRHVFARLLRRILHVFFRLLYYEFAWTYDFVSWAVSMGQWRDWQRTALPYLRGQVVLEVAHGPGHMLLALSRTGRRAVGLDLSPQMGRQAARRLRRHALPAQLARGSADALPFASGHFSSVLSTFPTEFVGHPAAIAEFHRVLQPGGAFVCVPAAQITGPAPPDRFAEWLFRVTGQSAEDFYAPVLTRYRDAGFQVRVERVTLKRSLVTAIVAEKGGERSA
jgi:ubiquinone/menaquinone biosynthesis C-methylase UbiE